MSFVKKTKAFFGLEPFEGGPDEAYFDEPRYDGNVAYAPRYDEPRSYTAGSSYGRDDERNYAPTIVPVVVESFSDATAIGKPVRDGDAVVFDLNNLGHDEAKRIVDFAAGLCFALYCGMQKLDNGIFAVVPKNSTISSDELKRAAGQI